MPVQTRSQTKNQREKMVEKVVEKPVERYLQKDIFILNKHPMNTRGKSKHNKTIESSKNFITTLKKLVSSYQTIASNRELSNCPNTIPIVLINIFEHINNHKQEFELINDRLKTAIFKSAMRIDDEIVYMNKHFHSPNIIDKLTSIVQITKSMYL